MKEEDEEMKKEEEEERKEVEEKEDRDKWLVICWSVSSTVNIVIESRMGNG